jgi:L-threonylcarbamoyladenylate synthase
MTELEKIMATARDAVLSGGVVVIPTETFYGLAADPFNEAAVLKVFHIKERTHSKPLPLIASDRTAVERLDPEISPDIERIMERYWPGSLTILLKTAVPVSRLIVGDSGKVGVRVPPFCAARSLAELVGGLITATSANLSGGADPPTVQMIPRKVIAAADVVVDLGPTPGGKPSTVVDFKNKSLLVIREGAVAATELRAFLGTGEWS